MSKWVVNIEGDYELIKKYEEPKHINIPEGATNGEALCMLFPNMHYTLSDKSPRVVTTIGVASSFDMDWWNSPYTSESEELDLTTCDNAISREAAIEAFQIFREYESNRSNKEWVDRIETVLNQLPPVTPQPKTGHWIEHEIKDTCRWLTCSVCGYEWVNKKENFCPDCGYRMIDTHEMKGGDKNDKRKSN